MAGLVFRIDCNKFLRRKTSRTGILIAGHHGRTIIGCIFSDKQRCTGHTDPPLSLVKTYLKGTQKAFHKILFSTLAQRAGYIFIVGDRRHLGKKGAAYNSY